MIEVFGKVVGQILFSWDVGYRKLILSYSVAYPMHTHINSFRNFLSNRVGSDANSCSGVAQDDRRRLNLSHVGQDFFKSTSCKTLVSFFIILLYSVRAMQCYVCQCYGIVSGYNNIIYNFIVQYMIMYAQVVCIICMMYA